MTAQQSRRVASLAASSSPQRLLEPAQVQARVTMSQQDRAAESPRAESSSVVAAYRHRAPPRRMKSARNPKPARVRPGASPRALATPFRGPASTCRVLMRETDCPLLPRPPLRDGSTPPRLVARLVPRAHSQSTNPTRHLRSRRIAVREASPNARPSPAPYHRPFRVDPGSLAKCAASEMPKHVEEPCVSKPRPRRKNKAISSEVAAHGDRPMQAMGTHSAIASVEPNAFRDSGRIIGSELIPRRSPRLTKQVRCSFNGAIGLSCRTRRGQTQISSPTLERRSHVSVQRARRRFVTDAGLSASTCAPFVPS